MAITIKVTVKDENGNPVKNAIVSIKHMTEAFVSDIKTTDANGKTSFVNVYPGKYKATAKKKGYIEDNQTLDVSSGTYNVYFTIHKEKPKYHLTNLKVTTSS